MWTHKGAQSSTISLLKVQCFRDFRGFRGLESGLPGGGGWIRTNVDVRQRIYSPSPLATRAPLQRGQARDVCLGVANVNDDGVVRGVLAKNGKEDFFLKK